MARLTQLVSALILILLSTPNLFAQTCPAGQPKTKIYFVNGIDNTKKNAIDSFEALQNAVSPFIQSPHIKECIEFSYSYNQNNFLFLDLVQSYSQLVSSSATDFWRFFARLIAANDKIEQEILRIFSVDRQSYISDQDLNGFVNEYYGQIVDQGKTVILVSHSQGNFYANESYRLLNPYVSDKLKIVSVATPDSFVGGDGPHTTLLADLIWSIVGALSPNVDNGSCGVFWKCHDFIKSYMAGINSQTKIRNNIISALPIPSVSLTLPNTGSIPEGGIDPNYILLSGPSCLSGNCPVYATVTDNFPLNSPWPGNTSTSRWIEPINGTTDSHPVGQYIYRLVFQINGDPNTVTLNGQWASDNTGTDILVNGISTGLRNSDAGQFKFNPFSITTGFQSGTNTLDFVVFNDDCGGCENPTGLRVEFTDPN